MKRLIFSFLIVSATILSTAVTCSDIPDPDPYEVVTFTLGAYFLNEGVPGGNNAELTQLNTVQSYVNQNCFGAVNGGRKLGDTGTDIIALGSKLYIALAGSKHIEVVNKLSPLE